MVEGCQRVGLNGFTLLPSFLKRQLHSCLCIRICVWCCCWQQPTSLLHLGTEYSMHSPTLTFVSNVQRSQNKTATANTLTETETLTKLCCLQEANDTHAFGLDDAARLCRIHADLAGWTTQIALEVWGGPGTPPRVQQPH